MERMHRRSFSWLAIVLCMALLMTSALPAPALAKSKKETFTIKWKVNGETVKKEKVKKGEMPEKPEDPADYSDGKYTYVFKGWEPKVTKATKDVTYKAKFKKTERKFVITWLDDEGVLIDFTEVKYGKLPKHDDPKKKPTKKYTYVFDGWDPELVKAKEDATYTATFKKKARKYTITWVDDKGNVIDETKVAYGKLPEHEDPVKKSEKYSYTFTGWKPELTEVTGDATYTATFEKGEKKSDKYTITWLDDEGNLIDTTEVKAGKKPTHDDPVKESTKEYTYTFTGWEPEVVKAEADATYTATFEQKARKYKITWLDDEGNLIDETKVAYGEMPTHADPTLEDSETHSYVFKGWEPELVPVTGKATYTAVFDEVPKDPKPEETPEGEETTYTITWLNDEGKVIDTTTVKAGEVPAHDAPEKAATEQYTYVFSGWTPEPAPAEANAAYTAVFEAVAIDPQQEEVVDPETEDPALYREPCTVIFQNYDGTELCRIGFTADQIPAYPDGEALPTRDPDKQYTYEFAGWKDIEGKKYPLGKELPVVTAEDAASSPLIYTAYYKQVERTEYNVTFMNEDGTVLLIASYEMGAVPAYKGEDPTTEKSDEKYSAYQFNGWVDDDGSFYAKGGELPAVTGDATYYAHYLGVTPVKYEVVFTNYDGTELQKKAFGYGEVPVYEGAEPTRPDDAQYTSYVFDGWTDANGNFYDLTQPLPLVEVGGAAYTASFTGNPVTGYLITFVNDTGEELYSCSVEQDDIPEYKGQPNPPEKAPDGQFTYEFDGWRAEDGKMYKAGDPLPPATAPATYTAHYMSILNKGTVNCYAYRPTLADAQSLLEAEIGSVVKLKDGTELTLDWSKSTCDTYSDPDKAYTNDKGDGDYVFSVHDKERADIVVNCVLHVGPATSKKPDKHYVYRLDSLGDDANAIITGWKGKDVDKNGNSLSLMIPVTVDGNPVVEIGKGVFKGKKLVEIVVPTGVRAIGDSAFADCSKLQRLTLPDTLSKVGDGIAKGDKNLDTVILNVNLNTTLDNNGAAYTICHEYDKSWDPEEDPDNPGMTPPVSIGSVLTDISVYASDFTMKCAFNVEAGHQIYVQGGMTAKGKLTTQASNGKSSKPGTILADGVFTCKGNLTNEGELYANTETTINGALDNSGTVYSGQKVVLNGDVTNSGVFEVSGELTCKKGFANTGSVSVWDKKATLTCVDAIENNKGGTFSVGAGAKAKAGSLSNKGEFTNQGTLTVGALTNSGTVTDAGAGECHRQRHHDAEGHAQCEQGQGHRQGGKGRHPDRGCGLQADQQRHHHQQRHRGGQGHHHQLPGHVEG